MRGKIVDVTKGATTAHVRIDLGGGAIVTASITNEAVEALGLEAGMAASAVIKASDVMVGVEQRKMSFVKILSALAVVSLATGAAPQHAFAAGEGGCSAFAWPIESERALLTGADAVETPSKGNFGSIPETAISVVLARTSDVTYPVAPTGKPKGAGEDTFGAVVSFDGGGGGLHQITLSGAGWIDVVQNGAALKSVAHTGKADCEGVRKSVRFELAPGPFAVQISGAASPTMKFTVLPAN